MMIVWPCSATRARSSRSTSREVPVSSAPVGSSANSTCGLVTSARAIATRCCWPPDSSLGRCRARSARPTAPSAAAIALGSGLRPASRSGNSTFCAAVSDGIRLKDWKTNPIRSSAQHGQRGLAQAAEPGPVDADLARVGPVEARRALQQGGLARAGRAHHRGEGTGGKGERHSIEGGDGGRTVSVGPGHRLDQDGVGVSVHPLMQSAGPGPRHCPRTPSRGMASPTVGRSGLAQCRRAALALSWFAWIRSRP